MTGTGPRRSSGFTLIEVMAAIALLGVFTSVAVSLSAHLFSSYRLVEGYGEDLAGCQRTLRIFRGDVVEATDVRTEADGVRIVALDHDIVYRLDEGQLTRSARGVEQLLARRLARFDVEIEDELVHLHLELDPRAREGRRRRAVLATSIRLRERGR